MGYWHKNDDFIQAYSQRAGVSTDEAAKVAENLQWIFCKDEPSEIDLDGLVNSADRINYEDSVESLEGDVSRLETEFANFKYEKEKEIESLENEVYTLKEKIRELEAEK